MKKILIAVIDNTGNEPEALRQSLERFGYSVFTKYIGRPRHLSDILEGNDRDFDFDALILSCHGDEGAIIMPELCEDIYEEGECRGKFDTECVEKHIKFQNKVIISTGCTTGMEPIATVFSKGNTYIAPADYIDGTSSLYFVISLFYHMANGKSLREAYEIARATDSETKLFVYSSN